jgi:hypothetical protein
MSRRPGEQKSRMRHSCDDQMHCPSAQPSQDGSVIIGVVSARDGNASVSLLPEPVPLQSVAHLIPEAVPVTEVLRLAGACAEQKCAHFRDGRCSLVSRIVAKLPAVTDRLSKCAIRPSCRWWHQEGPVACFRCRGIVTEPLQVSDVMREIARPPAAVTE